MSYGIVRVQKFKATSVRGIQSHDRRERDSRSNPDIDKSKTEQNYSLVSCDNFNASIQDKLKTLESTKAVRKDAVVMCQLLVTSDHEFFKNLAPEEEKAFFQDALTFIEDRYGKGNILSATVHKDEKTPHMHVNMTPIKERRLSAKTVFDRNELRSLHTDFYHSVGQSWGLNRGESREEKRRHLDTEAYKLQTQKEQLQERFNEMTQEGSNFWIKVDDLKQKVLSKNILGLSKTRETIDEVVYRLNKDFIKPMGSQINEARKESNELQKRVSTLKKELTQSRMGLNQYRELFQGLTSEQQNFLKIKIQEFKEKNIKEHDLKRFEMNKKVNRSR